MRVSAREAQGRMQLYKTQLKTAINIKLRTINECQKEANPNCSLWTKQIRSSECGERFNYSQIQIVSTLRSVMNFGNQAELQCSFRRVKIAHVICVGLSRTPAVRGVSN